MNYDRSYGGRTCFIIPFVNYAPSISALITIVPIALVTLCEHIGDHTSLSNIIGKDLIKDPGLDRTLLGDGIAAFVAGALGGVEISIVSGDLSVTISGMSLAAIIGSVLNLILSEEKTEEDGNEDRQDKEKIKKEKQ